MALYYCWHCFKELRRDAADLLVIVVTTTEMPLTPQWPTEPDCTGQVPGINGPHSLQYLFRNLLTLRTKCISKIIASAHFSLSTSGMLLIQNRSKLTSMCPLTAISILPRPHFSIYGHLFGETFTKSFFHITYIAHKVKYIKPFFWDFDDYDFIRLVWNTVIFLYLCFVLSFEL